MSKTIEERLTGRYNAAVRLEKIRQQLREDARYGFTITNAHREEVHAAEAEYDAATAAAAETS